MENLESLFLDHLTNFNLTNQNFWNLRSLGGKALIRQYEEDWFRDYCPILYFPMRNTLCDYDKRLWHLLFSLQLSWKPILFNTFLVQAKGHTEWISDGLCDDINNNPSCNYDGDDCCGYDVEMQYCYDCNCVCKYRCFN